MAALTTRPLAQLVHSTTGRVRFRFPEQRGNTAFFETLTAALGRHSAVLESRASERTGSVLVLHTGDLAGLIAHVQKRGLFDVARPPPPAAMRRLRNAIESLDDRVARGTGEALSVGKVLFAGLIAAAIVQANRGHMLPPGITLLRHALELMDWVAEREPNSSSQHRT